MKTEVAVAMTFAVDVPRKLEAAELRARLNRPPPSGSWLDFEVDDENQPADKNVQDEVKP